jgi:hypothetical protein
MDGFWKHVLDPRNDPRAPHPDCPKAESGRTVTLQELCDPEDDDPADVKRIVEEILKHPRYRYPGRGSAEIAKI